MFVFYLMAILGCYVIINFSKLLEKTKNVKRYFIFLGRNSMLILMVHMSIVHIVKDIFHLEQRNAASSLFGDSTNPMELVAFVVIVILVSLFVVGYNKLFTKKKEEVIG